MHGVIKRQKWMPNWASYYSSRIVKYLNEQMVDTIRNCVYTNPHICNLCPNHYFCDYQCNYLQWHHVKTIWNCICGYKMILSCICNYDLSLLLVCKKIKWKM
jgi:hypothetical protein